MTEHDVLVAAKRYLMEHGWSHGTGRGQYGAVCIGFAVDEVTRDLITPRPESWDDVEQISACRLLKRLIGIDPCGSFGLADWNDQPDRTFDDVIALLDRAILATAPAETPEPVNEAVPA